jgi:heterodisulfide reductase subunit A2
MKQLGVFVCHCGRNIAATVDVAAVVEAVRTHGGVVHVEDYAYMCSEPGQALLKRRIGEHRLDGVIVAACSPRLHENTFRIAARQAGLNPYLLEIANIREQCSWVHPDPAIATAKAIRIVRGLLEKVRLNEPLEPIAIPLTRTALVIGGGIAGIQAALSIANSGHQVLLVERDPSLGGHMAQLSETFPTLDCSQCILTPKMVEVSRHPRIRIMTYTEVESLAGFVGNFTVTIRQKARLVDWEKCTGCGDCVARCPVKTIPSEFERGLAARKAIYRPFPQAVPNKVVIDRARCVMCRLCAKACPADAIDYAQEDAFVEERVGAIVVATGYETYPVLNIQEYGGGELPDVIDGLAFERLLSASGPTGGEVRRPSDGVIPKNVVLIACAASRDPERYFSYCSKICCMYTAKHAMLYKHRVHDGRAYVFYMDIRAGGKQYEEFVQRATTAEQVVYLRGRVSRLYRDGDTVVVCGVDTLSGAVVEIRADLVVLATAMRPAAGIEKLARTLKVGIDAHVFLHEAHPKLRPLESLTAGIYLAGCAQAPRDIPDTVAQASGAAMMVASLFASDELLHEPSVVGTDAARCRGCGLCIPVCPYQARELNQERQIAEVNAALCEGCGACAAACLSGAAQQRNLTDEQLLNMAAVLAAD